MIKCPMLWLAGIWVGLLIHVDWHLGRPGHDHLSFGLVSHWLLAIPTFAPIPWLIARRWPGSAYGASWGVVAVGILVGQGLEPLSEVLLFNAGPEPFTNPMRWRVFGEFMVAGALTYIASAAFAFRRTGAAA